MATERKFLLLHVPKTAGSMFRQIVASNFGSEAVVENPLLSTLVYSAEDIERLYYLYPYRFYMGHVFRLEQALQTKVSNLQLISFVRDPIEKAISSYYYLRNRPATNPGHPVKTQSFSEMVDRMLKDGAHDAFDMDSSQLDWLVGKEGAELSQVKEAVASDRLILLPTECFDLGCLLLEKIFPDDFKDCSYASRVNVSSRSEERIEEERKMAERLPWIVRDQALHQFAKDNLNRMTDCFFDASGALEDAKNDFTRRCSSKANQKKRKEGGLLYRKIRRALRRIAT